MDLDGNDLRTDHGFDADVRNDLGQHGYSYKLSGGVGSPPSDQPMAVLLAIIIVMPWIFAAACMAAFLL